MLPNIIPLSGTSNVPITPTTPTKFETRNTGVTLEVEPVVGPDGVTIDLNLLPEVTEFEGFINYGSPIQSTSTNTLGQTITGVITPIVINQPIFSTRKVQKVEDESADGGASNLQNPSKSATNLNNASSRWKR